MGHFNSVLRMYAQEKDSWDLDGPQKIVMAAKKKDQGNELFKQGKLLHASKKYEKVVLMSLVALGYVTIKCPSPY